MPNANLRWTLIAALLLCCSGVSARAAPDEELLGKSLGYPVGTRALGLGTTLTTRHLHFEKEAEAALGLPEGVHSYAILPIGYPMGKFGPVGRGPLKEIVYQDRWGEPYTGV